MITYTPSALKMAEENVALFQRRLGTAIDKDSARRQLAAAKERVRELKAARDAQNRR